MIQALEPKKLIGSMMSVVTETGDDWIHVVFFNERGVFEICDSGTETRLLLGREQALLLVALLRVALAQFPFLHGSSEPEEHSARQAGPSRRVDEVRVEASRKTLSIAWPSGAEGVQRQDVDGQVELRLRRAFGVAIDLALLTSLAQTAAGVEVWSSPGFVDIPEA